MTPAVEARALSKRYGAIWALRDCELLIPPGRIVALVGPNGAGKTTLFQLILGLLQPTSGELCVLGLSPTQRSVDVLARVGFVAPDRPLYRGFTVQQMLDFGAHLNPSWDHGMARRRVDAAGIPLDRKVRQLSGGQQAQLALTLALAKNPELLVLDEPMANLDPVARREFTRVLVSAASERGLTVVYSSHVVSELKRFCDYLIVMSEGHVRLSGDVDDLLREFQRRAGTLSLEELVLDNMQAAGAGSGPAPEPWRVAR